ncbi:MAG: hypothetical protein NTW19_21650 [Planctomycetota bacterium]|nr:hypothetical protein [Planctomycetota bacterium]
MRSKRERTIMIVAGALVGLLALDLFVIEPLLDSGSALADKRALLEAQVARGQQTITAGQKATRQWKEFRAASLGRGASDTGAGLLNTLLEWSRDASLPMQSVRPDRVTDAQGLHELTYQAAADGSMWAMSRFLYRVESAKQPVRPRELQIAARTEGSDELTMQVRVSTLYEDTPAKLEAGTGGATALKAAPGADVSTVSATTAPAGGSTPSSSGSGSSPGNAAATAPARAWASPPILMSRDSYDVIYRRNIFRRGGGGGSEGPTTMVAATAPAPTPLIPATSASMGVYVLTGTAVQAKERVAFIENTREGVTAQVRADDFTAAGKVIAVEPEGLRIESGDSSRMIAVGEGLDGQMAVPAARPPSAEAGGASKSGEASGAGGAPAVSPAEAALIERMKARRSQELSK